MEDIDREIEGNNAVRRPRIFRDRADPFETLNDEQFRLRYRFSRRGFFTLLESLEDSITTSDRSCALLPAQRLAITLQSLASNTFQLLVADMAGCSQPTVSRTIKLVCKAICDKLDYFVMWPTGEDLIENQRKFKLLTNIPGIVGCVDGTHIRIPAPSVDEHIFVNRKSYHSLNVGLACDYDLSFIWISCRFGGSAHDSRVFRESALHAGLQSGEKKGILLGDSAYRAETYLYKPILNSQNEAEKKYTDAVCRGRVRIENAIGVLKRQFHSLHSEVRYAPDMASLIITAAVCLRNASISLNERPFEDDLGDEDDDDDGYDDPNAPSASGQAAMKYVVQKYFS
ncbi:unnamed protein product [Caenorhabditis brenneri]